jgi:hypothetical protein
VMAWIKAHKVVIRRKQPAGHLGSVGLQSMKCLFSADGFPNNSRQELLCLSTFCGKQRDAGWLFQASGLLLLKNGSPTSFHCPSTNSWAITEQKEPSSYLVWAVKVWYNTME